MKLSGPMQMREVLGDMLPGLEGVMRNIDVTLVKIQRPNKVPDHSYWFNMRKKIYCINIMIFIYNIIC